MKLNPLELQIRLIMVLGANMERVHMVWVFQNQEANHLKRLKMWIQVRLL